MGLLRADEVNSLFKTHLQQTIWMKLFHKYVKFHNCMNPAAIYDMMIFWIIYFSFGMASDIQYTRDNHSQMHVNLRSSNNKCWLGFKIFYLVWKLQHSWRDLLLVETLPVHRNYYVLKLFHHKLWLILCSFWSIVLYCCDFGKPFKILHPNCYLVFQRSVGSFLYSSVIDMNPLKI